MSKAAPNRGSNFSTVFTVFTAIGICANASAMTPIESVQKKLSESPKLCHALETELNDWRSAGQKAESPSVPKSEIGRARELLAVCSALPRQPSNDTIKLIGKAVMEHKPTAEPIVEALVETECITECAKIAMALANSDQGKDTKRLIVEYLLKPKYPTLTIPKKHNELIEHGAKKGLWKLSKQDELQLESLKKALEKAEIEFRPTSQEQIKDAKGNAVPTKHPKYMEELQAALRFQEKQHEISKRLK